MFLLSSCSAYEVPDGNEVEVFRNAIEALPDQDNPELFGLHSNADLTFRRLQARACAAALAAHVTGRCSRSCTSRIQLPRLAPPICCC